MNAGRLSHYLIYAALSVFGAIALAAPVAEKTKIAGPTMFAEGSISTGDYESHPAFTPDGKTLYFVKSSPTFDFWTIVVSHLENGKWSPPQVAPFSGRYADADPFITADGSRFYFISNRPVAGKSAPELDIWFMEKTADGWGEPKNPGPPINSDKNEWFPTLARSGTIYFGSERDGGQGRTDIYRAALADGKYKEAQNLGEAINTKAGEFEPCIAPDESYLIFAAAGRPDGKGQFDLYVSYRRDNTWTKAANLGDKINTAATEFSPALSPDGRQFFFTSTRGFFDKPLGKALSFTELQEKIRSPRNGLGDIYQVELSALGLEK
jgi:Tol biopolymer transport system component